ncbi:MAG: cytochrome c oxidase subunit [Pseudomonadota bacterium]|jgi:cytochrome c oxidase subunit 2
MKNNVMQGLGGRLAAAWLGFGAGLAVPVATWANDITTRYNLRTPASQMAESLYTLHNVLLAVCLIIFVLVFGVMFYSMYAHRKSKGHQPADFSDSHTLEIAWTVVPFLIVVAIGVYATPIVMAQKDTTNADITIKATGYQWKWGYDYLKGEGQGIAFLSTLTTPYEQRINQAPKTENYLSEVDNPLVVPVGKKIRVVTTANDVIHAWMVPAFGVKQDAIPGFVRDTWFRADRVGTYNGHCAELCGKDHAFMPIVVRVVTDAEYTAWVKEKKAAQAAQAPVPQTAALASAQ